MDILVGSRDPKLRRRAAAALSGWGGRVATLTTGGRVLVEALDGDFGLVVLDTHLEGMGGRETLGVLRQVRPRVPVLFLHRAGEDVADLRADSRIAFVPRTLDDAGLIRAAERLVAPRRQKHGLVSG